MRDAAAYVKLSKSSDSRWTRVFSDRAPQNVKKTTDPMVRLLHEVLQGKIQCSSYPLNGQNPLNDAGTQEGQMKGLLVPIR
ncbi:hypothetical protein ANCDUO_02371 [Ancylostoma duodenale]|uniref:Uncharacterized protein n=1 Tax=Ancylostoma duodenale TaxID=51022 RepID=A0A0C2DBU2_9BILA|nr:hypothetical protein ANCDUO_02371 [Ancylostoma duodenale]